MEALDPKDEPVPSGDEELPVAGPAVSSTATDAAIRPGSRGIAGLRVAALGASVWLVTVLFPVLEGGVHSGADLVLVLLPLAALALGTRAHVRARSEATPLLAISFPVLISLAIAGRADPALSDRYGSELVVLSGLTSLAYAVAVAHTLARPSALRATRVSKIASAPDASLRVRRLRALVVGSTVVVAVGLAILGPALGSRGFWVEHWTSPEDGIVAADEGRVLVAILAAAVAIVALTVIVGPALRAPRAGDARPAGDGVTLATSIVLAVTGVMAWAILRFLERH